MLTIFFQKNQYGNNFFLQFFVSIFVLPNGLKNHSFQFVRQPFINI